MRRSNGKVMTDVTFLSNIWAIARQTTVELQKVKPVKLVKQKNIKQENIHKTMKKLSKTFRQGVLVLWYSLMFAIHHAVCRCTNIFGNILSPLIIES